MKRFSYQIPVCNKCGAAAQRKESLWEWKLALWGGLTCPNCGDPFVPKPTKNRTLHYLFIKFRRFPVLFSIVPVVGLLVGATLNGIIPFDRSHLTKVENVTAIVMGSIVCVAYGLLLIWFIVKNIRRQWTAFCDQILETFLDNEPTDNKLEGN